MKNIKGSEKNSTTNNRLAIYFFYDADGIADRYIEYYLRELSKVIDRLIVVVNGTLSPEGRDLFLQFTDEIIVRENTGLDVWAYKTALEYAGWDELSKYYEVILSNHTLMGPVYPFQEMFDEMDKRGELDFWGITKYLQVNQNPNENPYGYIPEHIQSHFVVYRKKFLKTRELKKYWDDIPPIYNYSDSIGKHESYFTKYFGDKGFRWDTYVNNSAEKNFSEYLLVNAPVKAIVEYKCPVFKRKSFFQKHDDNLHGTMGEAASELLRFLREETTYDTDMIFENIIRTCNMADIIYNLGLLYVLPENVSTGCIPDNIEQKKCALIMHIYYLDIIDEAVHYASSMPKGSDIFITTPFEEQKAEIEKMFSALENKVFVRIIENRGRDVSALLVGCADVIHNYQYICFWHDKKSKEVKPESVGRSWGYKVSNCVLASQIYVHNVVRLFEENPYLGVLSPLPPAHGRYFSLGSCEWGSNYENVKALAKKLDIGVPFCREKPPVAPLGTVFWFRGKALRSLAEYGWKYEDFPKEPNGVDGTLLHAIERIYGYAAQKEGYLSAYLSTDKIASLELGAYLKIWRGYGEIGEIGNAWGSELEVRAAIKNRLCYVNSLEQQVRDLSKEINNLIPQTSLKTQLRLRLKRWTPKWLYGAIVRVKRFFFGPHGIKYSYDENAWESKIAG